jgi:uncharacterized membrane protein YtjA (UPF0391 family)
MSGRQSKNTVAESSSTLWGTREGVTIERGVAMLNWSLTFLIIALLAALLGFAGIAGTAAGIAKILFVIFLVLFFVSLVFGKKVV